MIDAFAGAAAGNEPSLPVMLDVDTGRDDCWAILGAMETHHVSGIVSSYGNSPLALTTRNSLDIVYLARQQSRNDGNPVPDIMVWQGEAQPLEPVTPETLAELQRRAAHDGNGICNLTLPHNPRPAANAGPDWRKEVYDHIRAAGRLDYIVCGPLTNLARLIDYFADAGEDIRDNFRHVVIAGGTFDPGQPADFNFMADPEAVDKVLRTFAGNAILVPFDETRKLTLSEAEIAHLSPQNAAAAFSKKLMSAQAQGWSAEHTIMLHDPATLLALDNSVPVDQEKVSVVMGGENAGKLRKDPHGYIVRRLTVPSGEETAVRNHLINRYLKLSL